MKNKKGFTLIELLAVIIILGVLMIIAIPSVTKYITESRKKTLVTTMGNYVSGVVIGVNKLGGVLTEKDVIYAIPVDCVPVEAGGKNPFGEWSPVSENYWAYVLVQFIPESSSYQYGFTFKDSSGYGMNPITIEKLDKDGSQIIAGITLNKPKTGIYTKLVSEEVWNESGFKTNNNTILKLLEKSSQNKCEIKKSVKVTSGVGTDVGDTVKIGTENFYVIESNSNTVTLLTKNAINLDVDDPVQKGYSTISFSSTNYWASSVKKYPAYVYNENSNLYQYVEAYEKYLKDQYGIINIDAKLISYEQLLNLGCTPTSCSGTPDWLRTSAFWSGTASGSTGIWVKHNGSSFYGHQYKANDRVVRPILVIDKLEIDFN